jgi:P4 family phage/plasmid primase-like protien
MFEPYPIDTGFDTTPVTVTVSPAPATVETGFGDLSATPATVLPAAPTARTEADAGTPDSRSADPPVDTGFDTTPVTATVSPAPAPSTVETGFGDLSEAPAPAQQSTPTVNTAANTGEAEDADADKSVTDWNAVSAFMANVVAWPGSPTDPGHVGLWYSMPNASFDPAKKVSPNNKKQFISGWPYREVGQFVSRAAWVTNTAHDKFKDVWFCTSLQSRTGKTKQGKPKAQKGAADALKMKAIWIDIDVKPGDPKHYATHDEAWQAFTNMRKSVGLPPPSAVINTGGGLHIYWISDKPLLPLEWKPYAEGLKALLLANDFKFDPTCTADSARILRVPGTFNHKYNPPKPVELLPLPLRLYNFSQLDLLKKHTRQASAKTAEAHQLFAEGACMDSFKAGPIFTITGEPGLEAGIDKFGNTLLDPIPIFQQCGFYKEALLNGGANNGQPQWNLAVLGTTFMKDGNDIAHKISAAHSSYTEDDTQAFYDRKMAERTDRGIGYPSCAAIAGTGCKACAMCPLFAKGKSPLNIRPEPNQGGGTAQQTPNADAESTDSENGRLVVPKDDHMGRARIYRSSKRPNLYHYRDDYYDHEGGHYTIIADDTIRADLYEFLDHCDKEVPRKGKPAETEVVPFAPNRSSVSETGEALKAIGHVVPTVEQPHWLDGRGGPDPADLICFPNGILNISSNQFMPPDPMLFTPHGVGFDYNPNAAAPVEWLNFLDQVFIGEQDQIAALQEMFGYCLSSDVSQEKVFMLLGDKRSGKDTIRHTLQSLLSPTVICGPTLDSMGTNFGMSQLIGKQLAVVGDMRLGSKCDKDLLAEHLLKLSGRGLFTIDRKNKSHWTGSLPCKLLLISNEMPKLKDASGAVASRIITLRTRKSFFGQEDRHLFKDKIKPELPAILLWALDGLRRTRQRGPIAEPACSIEAREELAREGSPIMAFVEECLTFDVNATVDKNVLYSAYLDFAYDNGLQPNTKSWFYRELDTATASKVKEQRVRKGGVNVHNILGARISNPPPKRPPKNGPIVVYATAPAATTQTAEDIGSASESDVALNEMVENLRTSKTA